MRMRVRTSAYDAAADIRANDNIRKPESKSVMRMRDKILRAMMLLMPCRAFSSMMRYATIHVTMPMLAS